MKVLLCLFLVAGYGPHPSSQVGHVQTGVGRFFVLGYLQQVTWGFQLEHVEVKCGKHFSIGLRDVTCRLFHRLRRCNRSFLEFVSVEVGA